MILLYQNLSNRLAEKHPELNYIDWDNNQFENPDTAQLIVPPAVLIGINIEWGNLLQNAQEGIAEISVRIWINPPEDTYQQTKRITKYTESLQKIHLIHASLQGHRGTHFNALTRIRTQRDPDAINGIIITHTYQCNISENIQKNIQYVTVK